MKSLLLRIRGLQAPLHSTLSDETLFVLVIQKGGKEDSRISLSCNVTQREPLRLTKSLLIICTNFLPFQNLRPQILPLRIFRFDQLNLPLSTFSLDEFLSLNGRLNMV